MNSFNASDTTDKYFTKLCFWLTTMIFMVTVLQIIVTLFKVFWGKKRFYCCSTADQVAHS